MPPSLRSSFHAAGPKKPPITRARAVASLQSGMHEDRYLDVVLPVANALMESGAPEWGAMRSQLRLRSRSIAQRHDGRGRSVPRWFRGPTGREMTRLAGPIENAAVVADGDGHLEADGAEDQDALLLRSLVLDLETGERIDLGVEVATAVDDVSWLPSSDALVVNRVVA